MLRRVTSALERAAAVMAQQGVDALLIGAGADLRYLTGYVALPLERLTLLVARADGQHRLVVPVLERARAEEQGAGDLVELVAWGETEDPYAVAGGCLDGLADEAHLAVGDQLWATFLLGLQAQRPAARWTRASAVTASCACARPRRRSAPARGRRRDRRRAQRGAGPAARRPHRARDRRGDRRRDAGRRADAVDFTIVASGPNGASPHHESGARRLQPGDAVVVDIGGPLDGWFSDCTRNYVAGITARRLRGGVRGPAGGAGRRRAGGPPGRAASDVDAAARDHLAAAGYGDAFIHRTGHGIGLEVHEEPYIVAGNDLVLEEGMTFSIEPGIYLAGRFGMRIEDIVAVTADGCERLNTVTRDLVAV